MCKPVSHGNHRPAREAHERLNFTKLQYQVNALKIMWKIMEAKEMQQLTMKEKEDVNEDLGRGGR